MNTDSSLQNHEKRIPVGPSEGGIVGSLGWFALALPIFLIPGALAPVDTPVSDKLAAVEKAAVQAAPGKTF